MSGSSGIVRSAGRGLFALMLLAAGASAQRMKEYEFVRIVDDDAYSSRQAINRKGHVVFPSSPGRVDDPRAEIFLYRNGRVEQITNDNVADRNPDINDDGVIVWYSLIGGEFNGRPTYEIMMRYPDGEVVRLTDNDYDDVVPKINNRGEVVWNAHLDFGCDGGTTERDLFLFDGVETRRLTFDAEDQNEGLSNQQAAINDLGQIAWTQYDFCVEGLWTSRILFYDGSKIFQVSPEGLLTPQSPELNNKRQIVWSGPDGHNNHLYIWDGEEVWDLWPDGSNPTINDRGWVAFPMVDDRNGRTNLWLWRNGDAVQLTFSDDEEDQVPDMNRSGEITWTCGVPFWSDVCLYRRVDLKRKGKSEKVTPFP